MILDMINYLQELKTMILEKSGFPVIAFSIFWGCLYENARFWKWKKEKIEKMWNEKKLELMRDDKIE